MAHVYIQRKNRVNIMIAFELFLGEFTVFEFMGL